MPDRTLADMKSGEYPAQDTTGAPAPALESAGGVMSSLNKVQLIINQPDYNGGPRNTPPKYIYGLGQALNDLARLVTPWDDGISREAMDAWIAGDSRPFMEEARVIMEGLTQSGNVDMSIAGVNGIINGVRAQYQRR
jgi:hypothetical protein